MNKIFLIVLVFGSYLAFSQQKAEDPVAVDDSVTMMQYGTVHINVLANDYDPNSETIHIDDIDEEEGFEISFQDSIVTIKALIYYDWNHLNLDYRIRNESGESDRADIDVYFVENPDVPVPVMDFVEMNTQSELIVNLIENDSATSEKDIIIHQVGNNQYFDIEILSDQKSVKLISKEVSSISSFEYRIIEKDGNGLVSKKCKNWVNLYQNPYQPIAIIDSFYVTEGENVLLDVLQNDISDGELVIVEQQSNTIVDNKIPFIAEIGSFEDIYSNPRQLSYQCKNVDNDLVSREQLIHINILPHPDRPIAINDTIYHHYEDTIYVNPLRNDINPSPNDLVIYGSLDTSLLFYNQAFVGDGWFVKEYNCYDSISELVSPQKGKISLRITPPDSIELMDIEAEMKIGDILEIDLSDYTNIPDSIELGAYSNLGNIILEGQKLIYQLNLSNEDAQWYFYENEKYIADTVRISYTLPIYLYSNRVSQYIYIKIKNPSTINYLDIGHYSIKTSPFGMDLVNDEGFWGQFFPKTYSSSWGLHTSNFGVSHPWLANYSETSGLKVAGEQYDDVGETFYPGPLCDDYGGDYTNKYHRTWKLNKTDIDFHRTHYQDAGYEINETILNWPAGKITYNGKEYDQADFQDLNGNGLYEPIDGEYPVIYGDQTVMYIVNDGRYANWSEQFGDYVSDTLNMDVFVMFYGFDRPGYEIMQNTFFAKYKVINKSDENYEDFKFGLWNYFDPYTIAWSLVGCDSLNDVIYTYPNYTYGFDNKMLHSVTFLNQKMDKFTLTEDRNMRPFTPYDAKYQYMSGTWNDTTHSYPPYWAKQTPLNYVYPGNPGDPDSWNMKSFFVLDKNNNHERTIGGQKTLGTSGPHILNSGESLEFEFAFHFIQNTDIGYIESIDQIIQNSRALKECYQNDSVPGGGSFTGVKEYSNNSNTELHIYPNPAKTILYVDGVERGVKYSIYTLQGQKIEEGRLENEISIEHLSEGFYLLQIRSRDGKQEFTSKFVKQ